MTPRMKAVRARLKELELEHGTLTKQLIVKIAVTDPILHDEFEWDDTKAAEQHRLHQAGQLLRRFKLEVIYDDIVINPPKPAPEFVSVTMPSGERGYKSIDRVAQDRYLSRQSLEREVRSCINACERARAVADKLNLRGELEGALQQLLALAMKLEEAA